MKVKVNVLGLLEIIAGQSELTLELPSGSTYRDLEHCLKEKLGDKLPDEYWDKENGTFSFAISIFNGDNLVEDTSQPLRESSELVVVPLATGG